MQICGLTHRGTKLYENLESLWKWSWFGERKVGAESQESSEVILECLFDQHAVCFGFDKSLQISGPGFLFEG